MDRGESLGAAVSGRTARHTRGSPPSSRGGSPHPLDAGSILPCARRGPLSFRAKRGICSQLAEISCRRSRPLHHDVRRMDRRGPLSFRALRCFARLSAHGRLGEGSVHKGSRSSCRRSRRALHDEHGGWIFIDSRCFGAPVLRRTVRVVDLSLLVVPRPILLPARHGRP